MNFKDKGTVKKIQHAYVRGGQAAVDKLARKMREENPNLGKDMVGEETVGKLNNIKAKSGIGLQSRDHNAFNKGIKIANKGIRKERKTNDSNEVNVVNFNWDQDYDNGLDNHINKLWSEGCKNDFTVQCKDKSAFYRYEYNNSNRRIVTPHIIVDLNGNNIIYNTDRNDEELTRYISNLYESGHKSDITVQCNDGVRVFNYKDYNKDTLPFDSIDKKMKKKLTKTCARGGHKEANQISGEVVAYGNGYSIKMKNNTPDDNNNIDLVYTGTYYKEAVEKYVNNVWDAGADNDFTVKYKGELTKYYYDSYKNKNKNKLLINTDSGLLVRSSTKSNVPNTVNLTYTGNDASKLEGYVTKLWNEGATTNFAITCINDNNNVGFFDYNKYRSINETSNTYYILTCIIIFINENSNSIEYILEDIERMNLNENIMKITCDYITSLGDGCDVLEWQNKLMKEPNHLEIIDLINHVITGKKLFDISRQIQKDINDGLGICIPLNDIFDIGINIENINTVYSIIIEHMKYLGGIGDDNNLENIVQTLKHCSVEFHNMTNGYYLLKNKVEYGTCIKCCSIKDATTKIVELMRNRYYIMIHCIDKYITADELLSLYTFINKSFTSVIEYTDIIDKYKDRIVITYAELELEKKVEIILDFIEVYDTWDTVVDMVGQNLKNILLEGVHMIDSLEQVKNENKYAELFRIIKDSYTNFGRERTREILLDVTSKTPSHTDKLLLIAGDCQRISQEKIKSGVKKDVVKLSDRVKELCSKIDDKPRKIKTIKDDKEALERNRIKKEKLAKANERARERFEEARRKLENAEIASKSTTNTNNTNIITTTSTIIESVICKICGEIIKENSNYIVAKCTNKCVVEYHYSCWKSGDKKCRKCEGDIISYTRYNNGDVVESKVLKEVEKKTEKKDVGVDKEKVEVKKETKIVRKEVINNKVEITEEKEKKPTITGWRNEDVSDYEDISNKYKVKESIKKEKARRKRLIKAQRNRDKANASTRKLIELIAPREEERDSSDKLDNIPRNDMIGDSRSSNSGNNERKSELKSYKEALTGCIREDIVYEDVVRCENNSSRGCEVMENDTRGYVFNTDDLPKEEVEVDNRIQDKEEVEVEVDNRIQDNEKKMNLNPNIVSFVPRVMRCYNCDMYPINTTFYPCMHTVTCFLCSRQFNVCFLCGVPIHYMTSN